MYGAIVYGTLLLCTVLLCARKEEEVNEFVSAVCWKQNSNVIVAANSQGTIKVSRPKTIVMGHDLRVMHYLECPLC